MALLVKNGCAKAKYKPKWRSKLENHRFWAQICFWSAENSYMSNLGGYVVEKIQVQCLFVDNFVVHGLIDEKWVHKRQNISQMKVKIRKS